MSRFCSRGCGWGGDTAGFFGYPTAIIRPQKQAEARLQHSALHDSLTGLANRVLFLDRLNLTMARLKRRPDRNYAVVFLDVDKFKRGKRYSRPRGRGRTVACCHRAAEDVPSAAGYGGSFWGATSSPLLLDEAGSVEDVARVAERIQEEVRKPVRVGAIEAFVSASMGIALGSIAYTDADDIMQDADTAMYRAKANGKARHEFFDPFAPETKGQAVCTGRGLGAAPGAEC